MKSGDTLYEIAGRFGVSVNALKAVNGLSGSSLRAGQKLVIPATAKTQPSRADSQPAGSAQAQDTVYRVKSGADPHFFIREKDVLEKIAADATMKNLLSLNAAVAEMRRSAEHPLAPRQVWEGVLLVYVRALGGQV